MAQLLILLTEYDLLNNVVPYRDVQDSLEE